MKRQTLKTPRITLKRLRGVDKHFIPLKFVPETIRTEAICLAAVKENGYSLQYVPEAMKTEALCLAAVEQKEKGRIFRRIFDKHMDDPNDFEA